MKAQLRDLIHAVDEAEGERRANALLDANEAAHQADADMTRVLPNDVDRAKLARGIAAQVEEELESVRTIVADTARKLAEARADAMTSVARAMARAGQDLTCWRPADAQTAWNMAEQLIDVQVAKRMDLSPAYRQQSAAGDLAKSAAVASVLTGGEGNGA